MVDKKVYIQVYNKIILGMKVYKPTFKRLPNGKIIDGEPIEVTEEEARAIGRHCKIVDAPKKAKKDQKDQKEREPEEKPETKKDPGPEKEQEPENEPESKEPEKKEKPAPKKPAPKRGGKGKK